MEGCLSAYREEVMQLKHLDLPCSVVEHRLVLPCQLLSCMTTSPPARSRNPMLVMMSECNAARDGCGKGGWIGMQLGRKKCGGITPHPSFAVSKGNQRH